MSPPCCRQHQPTSNLQLPSSTSSPLDDEPDAASKQDINLRLFRIHLHSPTSMLRSLECDAVSSDSLYEHLSHAIRAACEQQRDNLAAVRVLTYGHNRWATSGEAATESAGQVENRTCNRLTAWSRRSLRHTPCWCLTPFRRL